MGEYELISNPSVVLNCIQFLPPTNPNDVVCGPVIRWLAGLGVVNPIGWRFAWDHIIIPGGPLRGYLGIGVSPGDWVVQYPDTHFDMITAANFIQQCRVVT